MLTLRKIAVTGGLSSGKSSVCRILKNLGAYVVSADEVVHQLFSHPKLKQKLVELLGNEVIVKDQIDRSKVAAKVFSDPNLLEALEKLIHPLVYREILRQYRIQAGKKTPPTLFVAEIPLLFESGGDKIFSFSVAVITDKERCFERFHQLTDMDWEEFNKRAGRQLPQEEKARLATCTIENNGSLQELCPKVENLYKHLSN